MGVVVRLEAYFPPGANPARMFRATFDRIADLSRKFSSYRDDSELRNVERLAWREPQPVSTEFAHLLGEALALARESGGAFDPTVGRVTRLLRKPTAGQGEPNWRELRKAWDATGWNHVELDTRNQTVFIRKRGMQLDLGGIAKGYIADQALQTLATSGVPAALVAIAGDIAVGAPPPGKQGWRVGLDAAGERGTTERHLVLSHRAVSSSGSRERHYFANGRRCSHVVTRSSAPCLETPNAVSVIAKSGLRADGLATALLALGRQGSRDLLAKYPGVRVYWAPDAPAAAEPESVSREPR